MEGKENSLVLPLDLRHIQLVGRHPDQRDAQQVVHGLWDLPEAVQQLVLHIVPLLHALDACDPFVDIQLLHLVYDIGRRDEGVHVQIDEGREILRYLHAL